ncbi:aliphatic sulfonate ABC transporter substrate-binding protein [Limosilactobacillus caecicola]|uniref:aliphatic sulfonate ABC transporter substrate-binding protein n=1 Tax=Limosilactobacillus caecicola TaxID=2941332 RepID=UPI0020412A37|nr:aliphatic sulfonate ABC transporter substrate-binding protein [Limosilactobacillus caecicola]
MKNNHVHRKIFVWLLIGVWIIIAYFGWRQATGAGTSTKTITIGYQAGDEFDISKTRGAFAKKMKAKGYTVKFKEFQNGSAEMQALANGSIDYARIGDTPGITALASGTKLTYVAAGASKANGSGILVKKGQGINSMSDLKGKTIAYTKGTSSEYMLRKALQKAGLSTSDVTLKSLDQSAAAVAFAKGKVDAWANWDPATSQAEVTENAKLLVNGTTLGVNNRSFIVAPTKFAKQNKAVTKLVIKYSNADMQWANKHKSKLVAMMQKKLKLKKAVVEKMVNRRTYKMTRMTKTAVKELQDIANLFYQSKIITKKVQVKDHVQYLK